MSSVSRMSSSPRRQRGLSLISVVLLAVVAVAVMAVGSQSVPMFLEYQAVQKAVNKAAGEASSVAGLRSSFDRAAQIDDIRTISGADLEVSKDGDRFEASFDYEREIHLVGPAYLVYRFSGSSKK